MVLRANTILLVLFLIISCDQIKEKQINSEKKELPKALDGGDILDYSSYRRVSLIDQIYDDIKAKDQRLKIFEQKLEKSSDNKEEVIKEFRSFFETNDLYYQEGSDLISKISSDELRGQADSLLRFSKMEYTKKIEATISFLDNIDTLSVQIKDYKNLLKLVITLPHIEEFQDQKKPSNALLRKIIEEQESLIKEEKNLINND